MVNHELDSHHSDSEFVIAENYRRRTSMLPHLSEAGITQFKSNIAGREREYIDAISTDPQTVREEIMASKEVIYEDEARIATPAELAATHILNTYSTPLLTLCINLFEDPEIPQPIFNAYYDYTTGVMDPLADIMRGIDDINGRSDAIAQDILASFEADQQTEIPMMEGLDYYLLEIGKSRQFGLLVTADPTGIDSINRCIADLQTPQEDSERMLDFQQPELVLHGALFTQRAYQLIYPLCEEAANAL